MPVQEAPETPGLTAPAQLSPSPSTEKMPSLFQEPALPPLPSPHQVPKPSGSTFSFPSHFNEVPLNYKFTPQ